MLRALGYPTLVSMESFRSPNFPLVADLLAWLVKRFDPDVDIPKEIETEDERVLLIRNAAQFMVRNKYLLLFLLMKLSIITTDQFYLYRCYTILKFLKRCRF